MHNFRKLRVWQEAMEYVVDIYRITRELPSEEKFGLISQMRRAAVSLPSNIAEGAGRGSAKDFAQFLNIATGSSYELESQLILTTMIGYLDEEAVNLLISRLQTIQSSIYNLKLTILKK